MNGLSILRGEFRRPQFRGRFWFWIFLVSGLCGLGAIALGILFWNYSRSLPSLEILERIEPSLITRVYGKGGALVHEFYTQRRIWIPEAKIPEKLKQAVFAIEDHSFHRHWGADLSAYPSAILPALFGGRARGASTLTQQLAKNLFLTPERSVRRKAQEIILAVKIERTYTKREILEFYFNQVYLGAGAYGFAAAAERYFGKPLDSLSVEQYALMAGLLQRPEAYRPDLRPEPARERRNIVLRAMRDEGFIPRAEWKRAASAPLATAEYRPPAEMGGYFIETVRQFVEKKWNEDFVYNQGARIYTTMDSSIQRYADSILPVYLHKTRVRMRYRTARCYDMPRYLKQPIDTIVRHWDVYYPRFDTLYMQKDTSSTEERKFPDSLRYHPAEGAILVIENETGAVRAMVGGENFEISKYNRAIQAVRSPGSAFKPFIYATAVDNGASPGDMLNDMPITIPDPMDSNKVWRPHNFDPEFTGRMSMRRALYKSQNLPAIEAGMKYGLRTVVSYARKFGLTHNVPPVPSLGIGSVDVTVMEMVSAFTAFPNAGVRPIPYLIDRIDDKGGRTVYQNLPQTQEVLRKEAAWILCTMLRDVNVRGTAASIWASGFNHATGGKTGTTNDYTDAWYIGFTRKYTAGIWIGIDDHSTMGPGHTGADDAVPVWIDLMRFAERDRRPVDFLRDFPRPAGILDLKVCSISGLLAQPFCTETTQDFYIAGHEPTEACTLEQHAKKPSTVDISSANRRRDQPDIQTKEGLKSPDPKVRKTF